MQNKIRQSRKLDEEYLNVLVWNIVLHKKMYANIQKTNSLLAIIPYV